MQPHARSPKKPAGSQATSAKPHAAAKADAAGVPTGPAKAKAKAGSRRPRSDSTAADGGHAGDQADDDEPSSSASSSSSGSGSSEGSDSDSESASESSSTSSESSSSAEDEEPPCVEDARVGSILVQKGRRARDPGRRIRLDLPDGEWQAAAAGVRSGARVHGHRLAPLPMCGAANNVPAAACCACFGGVLGPPWACDCDGRIRAAR